MVTKKEIRFIDLFSGIGGFRIAAEQALKEFNLEGQCVFSCDIDPFANKVYRENFGEVCEKDIRKVSAEFIPDHDLLLAGFPCQPFSIIGQKKGFEDTRGTLFFEIARILEAKRPSAFVLENVKQLATQRKGQVLNRILEVLSNLGYHVEWRILNTLHFGLPQKRERIYIAGCVNKVKFTWPKPCVHYIPLDEILEQKVDEKYYASFQIRRKRIQKHTSPYKLSIWHENKSGNVTSHPYSLTLRATGSYNYLLVNGERRLTEREMLRLQGFPESFRVSVSYSQARKLIGNAVSIPVAKSVIKMVLASLNYSYETSTSVNKRALGNTISKQLTLVL